jgi:hypothetical protein
MEWPKQLERIKSIYHTGIIKMVLDGINIKKIFGFGFEFDNKLR